MKVLLSWEPWDHPWSGANGVQMAARLRKVKKTGRLTRGIMLPFGLRLDPGPKSRMEVGDLKNHRRGNFVAMQLGKAGDEAVRRIGPGLEQGRDLVALLDLA